MISYWVISPVPVHIFNNEKKNGQPEQLDKDRDRDKTKIKERTKQRQTLAQPPSSTAARTAWPGVLLLRAALIAPQLIQVKR